MKRRIAAVAALGLIALVAGWYASFWRQESRDLAAAKAHVQQVATQVAQLDEQVVELRSQEKYLPSERKALRLLAEAVPEGPSVDQLLDTVNAAAKAAGVALVDVGTPEPAGWGAPSGAGASASVGRGPETISLSITVNGSNPQLLKLVQALDHQPRLYVVDSLSLSRPVVEPGAGHRTKASQGSGGTSLSVTAFYVSGASADPATLLGLNSSPAPRR